MKKRIAIIGTGISGLTCGYLLNDKADITVYEANDYIGGHTATVDIELNGEHFAIDTGFIVFNDWTYPNFIKLLQQLKVGAQETEMSFSVHNEAENIEYNGNNLNSLFAQRRNLLRPKFYRIVADILRFNKLCKQVNQQGDVSSKATLGEFLEEHRFSDAFCTNYILPMCAAIWSTSLNDIRQFPLVFFLQFFNNHGLLNVTNRPQWYTIIGGSNQYVEPLTRSFRSSIRLNSPVKSVAKDNGDYVVSTDSDQERYDEVIFACHSDQALAMLDTPTVAQQKILGAIPYADNEVVLHTDINMLPKRKLAWASWNYWLDDDQAAHASPATLTYNMNILQRINSDTTFCVTLNQTEAINPDKILRRFNYAHPQFSASTAQAQQARGQICGVDGLHFCGAYWYNGFHEDGVRSALDVCERFGANL